MPSFIKRFTHRSSLTAALVLAALLFDFGESDSTAAQTVQARADSLPARLTDAEFWRLVGQISETEGNFPSDNFTSNEIEVGPLAALLRSRGRTGGVYMGVGPEQNFSYIAAIRPKMAFIVDIRRQAVVQHLMYKAIFELSATRADFISLLFSIRRPAGLDTASSIQKIWSAYMSVGRDAGAYAQNLDRIRNHLTRTHGFALNGAELDMLNYVYESFYSAGPQIGGRGGGGRGGGGGRNTNFMILSEARAPDGSSQGFLASEAYYRTLKDLQTRNLIVPASGDFGGPKAIRAVGSYVASRGATITAYYLSNVEQYLFQDNKWRQFYTNVATLPIDNATVFIRPYAMRTWPTETSLCSIGDFLRSFNSGRITSNNDALSCAR